LESLVTEHEKLGE